MPLPRIVYKTRENNSDSTDASPVDNDQGPVFDDELLDAIAEVLADTRAELRDEWQAEIVRR